MSASQAVALTLTTYLTFNAAIAAALIAHYFHETRSHA